MVMGVVSEDVGAIDTVAAVAVADVDVACVAVPLAKQLVSGDGDGDAVAAFGGPLQLFLSLSGAVFSSLHESDISLQVNHCISIIEGYKVENMMVWYGTILSYSRLCTPQ